MSVFDAQELAVGWSGPISAADTWAANLVAGTTDGQLLLLARLSGSDGAPSSLRVMDRRDGPKRPVEQISVVERLFAVLALSDSVVSVHDLSSLKHVRDQFGKGTVAYALYTPRPGEQHPIQVCCAIKRSLHLYSWNAERKKFDVEKRLENALADSPRALRFLGPSLLLATFRRDFAAVNVATGAVYEITLPAAPPGAPAEGGGGILASAAGYVSAAYAGAPLAAAAAPVSPDEVLLARDGVGHFVGPTGLPTGRPPLSWPQQPAHVAVCPPFVLALLPAAASPAASPGSSLGAGSYRGPSPAAGGPAAVLHVHLLLPAMQRAPVLIQVAPAPGRGCWRRGRWRRYTRSGSGGGAAGAAGAVEQALGLAGAGAWRRPSPSPTSRRTTPPATPPPAHATRRPAPPRPHPLTPPRAQHLRRQYARQLLERRDFEGGLAQLRAARAPLAEVLGIFRRLLPVSSELAEKLRGPRAEPAPHAAFPTAGGVPDAPLPVLEGDVEGAGVEALGALVDDLLQRRAELTGAARTGEAGPALGAGEAEAGRRGVDTALLEAYVRCREALVGPFLDARPAVAFPDAAAVLSAARKYRELGRLHAAHGAHSDALALFKRLADEGYREEGAGAGGAPFGAQAAVEYLVELRRRRPGLPEAEAGAAEAAEEAGAAWLLREHPEAGLALLTDPSARYGAPHLVSERRVPSPALHTALAAALLRRALPAPPAPAPAPAPVPAPSPASTSAQPATSKKGKKGKQQQQAQQQAQQPPPPAEAAATVPAAEAGPAAEGLLEVEVEGAASEEEARESAGRLARALLLGRLGRLREAFALQVCVRPGEGREANAALALELLERHATRFEPAAVLAALPEELPVGPVVAGFVQRVVRGSTAAYRSALLLKSLLHVQSAQVEVELGDLKRACVTVEPHRTCPVCGKRIGTAVFALYPNRSTLVHYSCCRDRSVDPVTGHNYGGASAAGAHGA
eukprot:tig00001408_g8608.t1